MKSRTKKKRCLGHRLLFCACLLLCSGWPSSAITQESHRREIQLPDFPEGAAYLLSRLSNQELREIKRTEPVYLAILIREEMDLMIRREAVQSLAISRQTSQLTQLLDGLQRLEAGKNPHPNTFAQLGHLVIEEPTKELQRQKAAIQQSLYSSRHLHTQAILYAALVEIDQDVEKVWKEARASGDQAPIAFLKCIQWIRTGQLQHGFMPILRPLLNLSTPLPLRSAAAVASTHVPGFEKEAFEILSRLLMSVNEPRIMLNAMLALPPRAWKGSVLDPLVHWLTLQADHYPDHRRKEATFVLFSQLADNVASHLQEPQASQLRQRFHTDGIRTVHLRVIPHILQFDKKLIVTKAGQKLIIRVENPGVMPHNLVIGIPGSLVALGTAATAMINRPAGRDGKPFVPDIKQTLHATPLIAPGQEASLQIVTPQEPGDYPYVCTYPGHWAQMKGVLRVIKE